ncbi:hypothetical protein NDU88_012390 [Pleurodeles waltl]|uniref:Uncharacterized protein n=1 Tax=Pleurodeles waltl TaxID=8319 RepID=A0AAV7R1B5_PLEWA|nr:hypothetical protein NDU88_012390 [Pleurodeles waltl]
MDIHTLKEQFWQIKRQILDFYDEYVITYTRNLARGLFSSMHISLLAEPDILFICKVEEVTEQLMETTTRQFENLKKEKDHQLWLKEQYATSSASPKTAIKQIFPAMNECQKTAPVINISASSSDSLSACSFPGNIPVQLTESLRDLTPLDSKDGSESSEGSVSAPLSEQIKPKEEESHDTDSNSCTLRNQDKTFLEINGKLCNSVQESESSGDRGSCLAVNKPADSAVQMARTPEFSDCGDTPALSNNIIEFSENEETVPVSSELMDFSDREEIPAITKNVMDFSESLKISSVSKQTVEISDKEESQQSETKQPVIRNESLERDTVAASTPDSDLLFPATALPVSNSTVSEEQISDLPVSDFDVKSATLMPPAVSLKLMTPENQQSETEAQVLKDIICPTKTKDLNLNLVFEDLMISTVLSVLLQETIINSKARAENVGNSVKVISEENPVLFLSKEQPFDVNRVEDQLPVVQTPCKETISDTTNTPQSTCNEEIPVLSEDHSKELACGTSTFSDVNPVSKDLKTPVAPEFDTSKSSKTKENSDFFMFTLRTPVTHVSQVSMLCKPQTTINVNTAAETDKSCLSEDVTDLTVTNTPISSSKEESIEQETNVIKNTTRNAIPDLLAPESTSPETNSMHSSHINRTIERKDIGAHMGINTCFAHWKFHLWQDCKLINQEPDILFICKVEEVTEQLMETTTRQFENLKKEKDHQLWLKEQYATSSASPKTAIKQIFPAMNECQKTAPVINISASSSDSLSACSFPENIPVQLTESLRDLTPLDSKDGSESSEGSVSATLSEQIKPKEEESHDTDSNSCTLRNQDMTFLEINGKLCNSVEESESSGDRGSCLAVNKPADSAVQMARTPEFSDCGDTPALSNNIIEFSENEETVPVSSELMDFSDREEIPAITKNVMDFSESLKISSVSKQTVEISDKEESQQSETKQPVIRNESLERDTVAASTPDSDLLFPATALPVSNSTVSEEQISDLPVSDFDVKSATLMPPAVSLKLMTPENQQSETEAQVLKDIICPTKTKDLNLNLVFEDLMISTVLSVLLQETIINSKARAENVGNSVKVISEENPVLFLSKEQPFDVNRVEDQLPVVQTPCKETISDTTNTPQSTCNEEIPVLSEDHPKELACGTSTFSDVNPRSKDLKTPVAPEFDTSKSSKTKENSDFFMFTLRTPVTHVSQVSMLCKPQTTINVNTAAETDKSCLSEDVTDLTVTNTPIRSSKE